MKIYHNPRCSKSRCAIDWLQENNYKYEVVDYMNNPISVDELNKVLKALKMNPMDLIRKNEMDFNDHVKGKNLSDEELVQIMVKFPKLIERPIVVWEDNAVVARPLEKLTDLLSV